MAYKVLSKNGQRLLTNYLKNFVNLPFWYTNILLAGLFSIIIIPFLYAPIYSDEAVTLLINRDYSWSNLFFDFKSPNNHNLFVILSKLSLFFFGESEFAFRLPVIIAGILSIPLTYKVSYLFSNSTRQALIASILLTFSLPHLDYAVTGRGYELSLALSLFQVIITYKLLERKQDLLWTITFVIFGYFLLLAIPTNIYFLIAIGVFFTSKIYIENHKKQNFIKKIFREITPCFILLIVSCLYFYIIWENLMLGVVTAKTFYALFNNGKDVSASIEKINELFLFLASPWGFGFYFFIFGGIFSWKKKTTIFIFFLPLLLVPALLIALMKIIGPPRIYIYCLPFFLILAAEGINRLVSILNRFDPFPRKILFLGLILIGLGIQPYIKFKDYYIKKTKDRTSILSSLQTLDYIQNNASNHDLIVIPYEDRVLRRYLGKEISKRMLNILRDNKLGKILAIGNTNYEPDEIVLQGGWDMPKKSPLHSKKFKLVWSYEGNRVFEYPFKAVSFLPIQFDTDYENNLGLSNDSRLIIDGKFNQSVEKKVLQISNLDNLHIVGNHSIKIKKLEEFEDKLISVLAKNINTIDKGSEESYILLAFARKYSFKEGSFANITALGQNYTKPLFLNPYFGVFEKKEEKLNWIRIHPYSNFLANLPENKRDESKFIWQIIFALTQLNKGKHMLLENFYLAEKISHFDGFQSFYLSP